MDKIMSFLQNYNEILTGAAIVLMSFVLIIFLARILRQIKRLNRSLGSITENIQAYIEVILQEEPQNLEETEVHPEPVHSAGTEEENELLEQERKRQEEEVFNAVLQEYFS